MKANFMKIAAGTILVIVLTSCNFSSDTDLANPISSSANAREKDVQTQALAELNKIDIANYSAVENLKTQIEQEKLAFEWEQEKAQSELDAKQRRIQAEQAIAHQREMAENEINLRRNTTYFWNYFGAFSILLISILTFVLVSRNLQHKKQAESDIQNILPRPQKNGGGTPKEPLRAGADPLDFDLEYRKKVVGLSRRLAHERRTLETERSRIRDTRYQAEHKLNKVSPYAKSMGKNHLTLDFPGDELERL